ncbi:MAG TPA: serine/threonine-protein kinase [Labilithrix sp.]|nr:serine/threonine-protein kinase [Labilithrix sp.]
MTNPDAPPSQGLIAGKYQLVRMIGRGGMGSVWEARHVSLGTSSAIKFIEAEYADSQEARSRFDKEAKAAATIQSKHAIQIFDHGVTDDGKPYIVMELLQGEPLDKRIERLGRLPLQDTARILQQVSRGLARAHERGIIHRDLKPENIFIVRNSDDDDEVAKVLDFGIAKMSNGPTSSGITSSTKTGAVLGTPFYMSPEQARGLRNVDHRTDVWSLGVIAFKCITGTLPFDGESVGDLLVKICTAPVPVPSHVAPGIPSNFDAWFMRAMEREPERRFANVTELSDALCFAAGLPVRSAQGSVPSSGGVGMPMTHAMQTPVQGPNAYASPPGSAYGRTPAPAAMTNSPLTSETAQGVPTGKGKLVAAGIVFTVAAIAATLGIVLFLLRKPAIAPHESGVGAGVTQATAAAAAVTPLPPVEKDKPPEPLPAADPTSAPSAATAAAPTTKPTGKPPPTPPPAKVPAKPQAPAVVPPLPPATPATVAPPPPAPTTKKLNKHDPGY